MCDTATELYPGQRNMISFFSGGDGKHVKFSNKKSRNAT
jgi:hypothetical protein